MIFKKTTTAIIIPIIFSLIFIAGCATSYKERHYVSPIHPYHKTFNADAETVFNACTDALSSLGWTIVEQEKIKEITYELNDEYKEYHGWIYTDTRSNFWGIYASGMTLNLFIKPVSDNQTDVIIHYLNEKAVGPFFDAPSQYYKNDEYINKIYNEIAICLKKNISPFPDK